MNTANAIISGAECISTPSTYHTIHKENHMTSKIVTDSAVESELTENSDKSFADELESLINMHSQENLSNTPDYILAEYLTGCLNVFNTAVRQREVFWGRKIESNHTLGGKTIGAP